MNKVQSNKPKLEKSRLLEGLNKEQASAVTHRGGPLLIVAGAGTGKTTVITRRIAWLIEHGRAKPDQILALTFTDKAAAELEERVDKLLPLGYVDTWISTFHAFAKRILDAHGLAIGLPIQFHLFSETKLWALVRQNLERFELDYYQPLGNPSRFIHALLTHFSRAKDELITPQDYLRYSKELSLAHDSDVGLKKKKLDDEEEALQDPKRVAEVAQAYATYQKLLVENNALDYGDLISYCHQLLTTRPEILRKLKSQFRYILIDEFQDTNLAQYELIKLLARDDESITVVGDDDQSIYKFRGASVSNILRFKIDFPKAQQITLIQNYRSCQNLLDATYRFIQLNSPDRLEDKLHISKKLVADRSGHGRMELSVYPDYHREADSVVAAFKQLKESDPELLWSDFAILVRANDTAEPFVKAMESLAIPFTHLSRRGLYRKAVVADLISYFRLLDNYHESQSLYKVLQFPIFVFTHDDLATIVATANRKSWSLYEAIKHPVVVKTLSEQGQKGAQKLLELLAKHTESARTQQVTELFVHVVADLGLAQKKAKESQEEVMRLSFLDQFYRKIKDFAVESAPARLTDFMAQLEMELDAGSEGSLEFDPDLGPDAIKILTVHSAKGLEFKYVFLPALADKKFPALGRSDPIELPDKLIRDILPTGDAHIQEERRLFYVAMTRARDGIFLSYAQDYGGSTVRKPSLFIKELGLISEVALPTGRVDFTPHQSIKSGKTRYPMPKSFSFTAISSFRKCPLDYKYSHILKVPRVGSGSLSFGQTIHGTLEKYLKLYKQAGELPQGDLFQPAAKSAPTLPSEEVLLQLYSDSWVDDWYEDKTQKEKYKKRGKEILKVVRERFLATPPTPKYIEQSFKLGLGSHLLTGKIDRADTTPEGLLIVDYKTGAPKTLAKVDREQLLIYQCAAQEFLHEKVAGLEYWYFVKDQVVPQHFLGTTKQIEETKQGLGATIDQIVEAVTIGDFERFHKPHQDCEYVH